MAAVLQATAVVAPLERMMQCVRKLGIRLLRMYCGTQSTRDSTIPLAATEQTNLKFEQNVAKKLLRPTRPHLALSMYTIHKRAPAITTSAIPSHYHRHGAVVTGSGDGVRRLEPITHRRTTGVRQPHPSSPG